MADKNIGMLPQAAQVEDDSLLVMEQQGAAMKLTGRQLKDYAKQGVELEFQEDLEAAQAAADRAEGAVRAVEDMTVSARTLESGEPASVAKTEAGGVFHLAFGLPQGERGAPGEKGDTGPRGAKGDPGTGLTILGYYDTPAALEAAVPAPEAGDAYGVGTAAPYDAYVFDGASGVWRNNGPLAGGGGGGPLPENVVTSGGGAELEIPASFGDTPHTVSFTDEEEPPLTAEDVAYSAAETVKEAIDGLKASVSDGKALVASAITDKGVPTAQDAAFAELAENIAQISGGGDTSDATATPGDILAGKTAYTASGKVEGIIPTLAAGTITPGTADQTIAGGQYLGGTQVVKGDQNLTPANIRQGVSIFGVAGAMTSQFKATLTVTADAGAVVSATHTNGTKVEDLSANGKVTLELPIEGQWTVTARRGVAQYNSVVIEVSSSYSAKLTAEVHIEYYLEATPLSEARSNLAATTVGKYALFGGGRKSGSGDRAYSYVVEGYDANLTKTVNKSFWETSRGDLAAATVGDYALFGGGCLYKDPLSTQEPTAEMDSFNGSLTQGTPTDLRTARSELAAASIGSYALFAGGVRYTTREAVVDAYNTSLTRSAPTSLVAARSSLAAASAGDHVLFGGGWGTTYSNIVDAYNADLTRSNPASLSLGRRGLAAAAAGSYILFAGGRSSTSDNYTDAVVDAYDLFLTRTTPEKLSGHVRENLAGVSVGGYALFGGGMRGGVESYYNCYSNMDVYDAVLTRTTPQGLSVARSNLAASAIGNYALFGGGGLSDRGLPAAKMDVYQHV